MAPDPRIGTKIQKRRQVLHLTQEDLAARLGVSKSTVANWESGKHFPLRYLGAVEHELGINLSGDEEMRIISPRLRRIIREELGEEDQRRVIGLLEGTLSLPPVPPGGSAAPAEPPGDEAEADQQLPG